MLPKTNRRNPKFRQAYIHCPHAKQLGGERRQPKAPYCISRTARSTRRGPLRPKTRAHKMNDAFVDMMMATMMAKIPRADAKISITKILTKSSAFCASARAHPLPQIPTHTLRTRQQAIVSITEPLCSSLQAALP